jgi:hypothetical protein
LLPDLNFLGTWSYIIDDVRGIQPCDMASAVETREAAEFGKVDIWFGGSLEEGFPEAHLLGGIGI